jgi:hypothetical protein
MHKYLAQINNPVLPPLIGGGDSPSIDQGGTALGKLLSNLIGAIFIFGFLLALLYLLLGALNWITSGGDKAKLEHARDAITNALIGLVVLGSGYAVALLAGRFFGLELGALPIPAIPTQ